MSVSSVVDADGSISSVSLFSAFSSGVLIFRRSKGIGETATRSAADYANEVEFPELSDLTAGSLIIGACYHSDLVTPPEGTTIIAGGMAWITDDEIDGSSWPLTSGSLASNHVPLAVTLETKGRS